MSRLPSFLAGVALTAAIVIPFTSAARPQDDPRQEMLKRAQKYVTPGPHHAKLERFVGKWETEWTILHGENRTPPSKGSAEFSWLFEGRWLQQRGTGALLEMPLESFSLIGYDNFKQSYVSATASTLDTALHVNEGDMVRGDQAMIAYGTLDEYLTGEHDKMVKTIWRFISKDEMVMEVHDLHIGEQNTQVIEIRYTRK